MTGFVTGSAIRAGARARPWLEAGGGDSGPAPFNLGGYWSIPLVGRAAEPGFWGDALASRLITNPDGSFAINPVIRPIDPTEPVGEGFSPAVTGSRGGSLLDGTDLADLMEGIFARIDARVSHLPEFESLFPDTGDLILDFEGLETAHEDKPHDDFYPDHLPEPEVLPADELEAQIDPALIFESDMQAQADLQAQMGYGPALDSDMWGWGVTWQWGG